METPQIFLASEVSARGRVRPQVVASETLSFEPGMLGLHLLCAVVCDQPMTNENSAHWMKLVAGPPNPETDEGFQVYRINARVAERLVAVPDATIEDLVARWCAGLERILGTSVANDRPRFVAELGRLRSLARRGAGSARSLFVKVLYR